MSSTQPLPRAAERPLSPHLQIYKPQLTSGLSIFHRITGVILVPGLMVFVAWLACLAMGPKAYDCISYYFDTPLGAVALFGWSAAFFYHLCMGFRHLLWAAGLCLSIERVYSTGRIAFCVAVLLTLGTWIMVLREGVFSWL